MTGSAPIQEGACRCGRVRFVVKARPLVTMACHCTGCQRMTASAFSLSALHATRDFEVVEGEPVIGGLHGSPQHFFCAHCMSWLFTRLVETDAFVNVRATMLDGAEAFRPFIETYTCEKLPWATTGAVHAFEKFPPNDVFPSLIQAYAAQGG